MDLDQIRQKHNLSLIIMHGSQVTGKTHSKSDVDIAVVRNNGDKELDLLELIIDLETQFSQKVDVSDITFADPLFLFSVIRKCKLLSGNPNDLKSLEEIAFFKYSDYIPYLKMESDFINERMNKYVAG